MPDVTLGDRTQTTAAVAGPPDAGPVSAESLHLAYLLERAQAGASETILPQAEAELRSVSGDLADGSAGLHFVRIVSLIMQEAPMDVVMPACDLMLNAAQRPGERGWLACAYSIRALQVLEREGERSHEETEAALRDLATAEAVLDLDESDAVQACNAHANLGIGYEAMRLYELAEPHYRAAHAASLTVPDGGANPPLWSGNLSLLHLQWALELYRVGEEADAERHSVLAREAADLALREATTWSDDVRVAMVRLQRECALADGPHVEGVAERLQAAIEHLRSKGVTQLEFLAAPFLAVALARTGRQAEALASITQAWEDVQGHRELVLAAAISHTRAVLLAQAGSPGAQEALAYGDVMARLLWTERLRTLRAARNLREYEHLRTVHEEVALRACTDPLTGIANRRAFEDLVDSLAASLEPAPEVGVLVIDMDRFKAINDSLGHEVGDETLRRVAGAISQAVRADDTVARLGGDEFVVVLPEATIESASTVAQRAIHQVDALGLGTSVSVGVAVAPANRARAALIAADAAMYIAKRAGGGRLKVADRPLLEGS